MADFLQAVKWKLEGKPVFHQGHNMILNDDCLSMSDIIGHMGKSLDNEDFYYDTWEIYEKKINDTPTTSGDYAYVFPEKLVDDCCDKLTPEAIENVRKQLEEPTTDTEKEIMNQDDCRKSKKEWDEEEEHAMRRFGYAFKERNTNNEIIFKKSITKEESLSDKYTFDVTETPCPALYYEYDVKDSLKRFKKLMGWEEDSECQDYKCPHTMGDIYLMLMLVFGDRLL